MPVFFAALKSVILRALPAVLINIVLFAFFNVLSQFAFSWLGSFLLPAPDVSGLGGSPSLSDSLSAFGGFVLGLLGMLQFDKILSVIASTITAIFSLKIFGLFR